MRRVVLLLAATYLLATACAGHPWWYQSGESSCGPTYLLRAHGHVVENFDSCQATAVQPPPVLHLHVGDRFDLHVADPAPSLTQAGVVRRLALEDSADPGFSTLSFVAVAPGSTQLMSDRAACTNRLTRRSWIGRCSLMQVSVSRS